MNAYVNLATIRAEYAPYDRYEAFDCGFLAYQGKAPEKEFHGVYAQAYDRGQECAMRLARANAWVEANVGTN